MSTETTAVAGVRLTQLPKVDLLPPEIAEEAKFRTVRLALAVGVAASVAIVGFLWYTANSSSSGAQQDLASAQDQQAKLHTTLSTLSTVPATYAAVTAAQSELTSAMGNEVRFSFILSDLSMTIPARVWLTSVSVSQDVDGGNPPVGAWGDPGIATLAVSGNASKYPDVAAWLQMLGKGKYYTDPYFSDAHLGELIGGHPNVGFTSTVIVTNKAYSNLYTNGSTR
jgi:Tfp pilus assembly protein PilN